MPDREQQAQSSARDTQMCDVRGVRSEMLTDPSECSASASVQKQISLMLRQRQTARHVDLFHSAPGMPWLSRWLYISSVRSLPPSRSQSGLQKDWSTHPHRPLPVLRKTHIPKEQRQPSGSWVYGAWLCLADTRRNECLPKGSRKLSNTLITVHAF